jgi:putative DNA primase/helicase
MEQSAIEAALREQNALRCEPPLPEAEVQAIAKSVARYTPAAPETDWPSPQPLDRERGLSEPYPLDALPGLIGAAVEEYQAFGQQPLGLVASSALSVVSLVTQGLADVQRGRNLQGPISLNFMVVAQSGERKTAADRAMGNPLSDWEQIRGDLMADDIAKNKAAIASYDAKVEGLKAAIKSSMRKHADDVELLEARLADLVKTRPTELVVPRLRYEDVNPQSLASSLATGHPSAALWSDEGGMVTGSHGMGRDSFLGFMAMLNRLWDGGSMRHDRKQAASVHVDGRRLTVSLMLQPAVLGELLQRGGGLSRGSGFLARFLVAAPASTMGTRLYREPAPGLSKLAQFHQRVRELLDQPLPVEENGRLLPPTLVLNPAAFDVWRSFHDDVERELVPLGDYRTVCDFAAKSAENAARIAGCLQVFSDRGGAIAAETMERAAVLAHWHLREALRLMEVLDEPQQWTDARALDNWLAARGDCPARDVLREGPGQLRDKARRNAAINVLEELGRARRETHGPREMLVRNPQL